MDARRSEFGDGGEVLGIGVGCGHDSQWVVRSSRGSGSCCQGVRDGGDVVVNEVAVEYCDGCCSQRSCCRARVVDVVE